MIATKLSPRVRGAFRIIAALLVLFTVIGFFVLPPIVRSQLEKRLSAALNRPVTIEKVRINPYALSVTLENLQVRERDATRAFLGWKRLYVNFGAFASLMGDWVLSEIELDGFRGHVVINQDATLNFSDLLAKAGAPPAQPATAPPAKPSRALRIDHLKINDARVDFADNSRKKPFQTTVGPLSFSLNQFRTAGERGAPYHLEAVSEAGEKLVWTGTLSADPFHSAGEFGIENLNLPKYAAYEEQVLQADITAGRLTLRGRYEVGLDAKHRVLKLTDGGLSLRELRIAERASGQPAVELAALEVAGVNVDGVANKTGIGRVALSGGHLTVRREKDGALNLLSLLPPKESAPAAAPAPAPSGPPLDLTVGEVALNDFKVDFTDLAAPRPVQLGLSSLQSSLKNVTLAEGAAMPVQLSFAWAPQGTLQIEGSVSVKPVLKLALKVQADHLAILPLSPYLEQSINARITDGTVSTSSSVQFASAAEQPAFTLEGDVHIERFDLVDGAHLEKLAGFSALALSGLKVSTAPQLSFSLAEVTAAGPYARVIMEKDKSLNLGQLTQRAETAPAEAKTGATTPASPTPAPKVEIARVVINDGDFSFTDRSLEPNVKVVINQFGGTIAGLSSANLGRADVDLKAAIDGAGPVTITGKLDPLSENKFVDLKVDFKSVDLLPLSPYSGKYAGYELARGKLFLATNAKVADRKIDVTNVVTIEQFTFGNPVNSPDATALPVRLGVALLKDVNGRIVLDVPVEGSFDDPNFRIGKVVLRVIVNLLTKAAVSPFSLLGAMFGGGGDELAYQEFAPGASALLPEEGKKLETLVKALTNRPGLNLDVEGSYDAAADTYALKQQKLADLVRRQVWEARRASDPNIPPPEQLTITPEEHVAVVKKLFDEKFPPGTEFGTPLPQPPPVAAPPSSPPPGLFKRVVNVITFEGMRSRRAAEKEQTSAAEELKKTTAMAVATGLPLEVMTARLAETMEVNDNDLRALAAERAEHVRAHLLTVGKIAPERLFLANLPVEATAAKQNKGPRVFLQLR